MVPLPASCRAVRYSLRSDGVARRSAPCEARPAESHGQVVGRHPPVAPVAVWEWMDSHEAMVKPDGRLAGLVGGVFDPGTGIVDQ